MRRALGAHAHADHLDEVLDQGARIAGRVDGQLRADQLDHVRAGERGLVDARGHARQPRAVQRGARTRAAAHRRGAPRAPRFKVRYAVELQTARIGAPLFFEFGPRQRLGFDRARGLLRGRQLRGGRFPVDDNQVVARPFAQPGRALRPRLDARLGDAGDLSHPGMLIDGRPLESTLGVQFVPQHRLVDDAGGFGLVVQRLRVEGHQLPVGAGLAVGHDDMGVQVGVAAP
jgi:hypothetical protein